MDKEPIFLMDSHAHLSSDGFKIDGEKAVENAMALGHFKIINVCTEAKELEAGLLLEKKYPSVVKNVAATTPHDAHLETEEIFNYFQKMAMEKKIVGIGETGFDDFIEPNNVAFQKKVCRRYIDLGVHTLLPLIFHVRGDQAFKNLYEALGEFPPISGMIHCFTGNDQQAKKALDLGLYLSISGIVTFKKSSALREVVKKIPLDRLLIETDSPWLSPEGYRGKPNEPAHIVNIAQTLATIYGVSVSKILSKTYENGSILFV
jgi:TatD DNase family protein